MNELDLLIRQNRGVQGFTSHIISQIPKEKWDVTPEVLNTNVSWQVGHLVISHIYHCIASVHGSPKELYAEIDIRTLVGLYGYGSDPIKSAGANSPDTLLALLELSATRSIESINSLKPEQLDEELAPTRVPHPVAKNKRRVLTWNVEHTMYHNGQLAILKRVVDKRMDYGLDTSRLKS